MLVSTSTPNEINSLEEGKACSLGTKPIQQRLRKRALPRFLNAFDQCYWGGENIGFVTGNHDVLDRFIPRILH